MTHSLEWFQNSSAERKGLSQKWDLLRVVVYFYTQVSHLKHIYSDTNWVEIKVAVKNHITIHYCLLDSEYSDPINGTDPINSLDPIDSSGPIIALGDWT